ncbi:MAG: flagellar basal body P-ring formation chaperone FlgA [bacterium]
MIRGLSKSILVLFFVPFASGEVVSIGERVAVESEQISLGDIAQILPANPQLAGVPLGYAPYPGHYRWITKPDIQNYLYKWGFDGKVQVEMDERVLITRESQQVEPKMIEEKVRQFLGSLNPDYKISIQQLQIPDDLFLPTGAVELSIDSPSSVTRLNGLSLKLDFYSEGERLRSQWVRVNAVAEAPVVIAKQDVPYGQTLRRSDLQVEVRQFERLDAFFTTANDVVGNVAKRSLKEGEILTRKDLKEAVLVHRGDVVTLMARGPSFVVSALGKSRDSGGRGDSVMIENLDSRQLVYATVVGNKTVEVVVAGGSK